MVLITVVQIAILSFLAQTLASPCPKTIIYLPLDERFTTRNAFLNLAELTPYCIKTPSPEILPLLKRQGDLEKIHNWVDENVGSADAFIVSAEMFLYGGLIASRISNDTFTDVEARLQKLFHYSVTYPKLNIYVSNVVMRIPSYDGDFEEPWYVLCCTLLSFLYRSSFIIYEVSIEFCCNIYLFPH